MVLLTPSIWINGRIPKLPTKPPPFTIEIMNDNWPSVSGPVGNVLFLSCRSL